MANYRYIEPQITSYLFQKASRNRIPLNGTFELSPVCNFDCKMCYVHMTPQQVKNTGRRMMSVDDWISLANEAKEMGMLYLLLTGGEPFLYPDFRKLYEKLAKMGFLISINSNGSLINEEVIKWLKPIAPARINITLYGATNETYKKLTGDAYGFDKVSHAIMLLKNNGFSLKLNCSLTPYNAKDLDEMIKFADKNELVLEIATYMFPAIRKSEDNIGKNNRFTAKESAFYLLETIRVQRGEKILQKYVKDVLSGITPCINKECMDVDPDGQVQCRAGKATFWVTWDGKILPCGMMVSPSIQYNSGEFSNLWKDLNKKIENIRLSGICSKCSNKEICHVCAAMAYAETGTFEKTPSYLCEMVDALYDEASNILKNEKKEETK